MSQQESKNEFYPITKKTISNIYSFTKNNLTERKYGSLLFETVVAPFVPGLFGCIILVESIEASGVLLAKGVEALDKLGTKTKP